ncbi:MAG: tetratricopeptide repeat protein [Alphaproteobacteria bacterium]|nr:tetratricopeptide repeat protein [Alphaproteobacteria bacterium]
MRTLVYWIKRLIPGWNSSSVCESSAQTGARLLFRGNAWKASVAVGAPARLAAVLALLAALNTPTAPPAIAARGEATSLHVRNGALALQRGKSPEAVQHYTTALDDRSLPDDRRATILNDRGVAYVRLGKTREAIDDFNKAVELFPEYAATYNNRGNLLLALGLIDEATKDFDRAIALAPGYAAAYNNRAGALMQKGSPERAIRDFTQAVTLLPAAAAPLAGRGRAHLELGRPHAAIRDFSRAVGSDARFASGYRSRAEAKLRVGHYNEAIEDLSRAIAFDISNVEAYTVRGQAYLSTGNFEAAIGDFTKVIELRPQDARGYEARGLANAMAGIQESALVDLNRAIELNPRSAQAFAYRGYAYTRSGQPEIAKSDLRTAAKIDANDPEVLWAKAATDEVLGDVDSAIADLQKALKAKPNFKRAKDALARLGVSVVAGGDKVMKGLGTGDWQVVVNGQNYFAVNVKLAQLRVPLEMMGEGKPRLLSWEEKEKPFRKIGVLTYHSGVIEGPNGAEEMELAAIIDQRTNSVVAIQPHRQGKKVAGWTWGQDGTVTVASVDGVTDQFKLRQGASVASAVAGRKSRRRRRRSGGGTPAWAPWAEDGGFGFNATSKPRRRARKSKRRYRKKKKKSIFQLLFN